MYVQGPKQKLQPLKSVASQFSKIYAKTECNTETPKQKTLNNALVSANEVYNTTWKYSQDNTPSHK